MKNFIENLKKDVDNLVKESEELTNISNGIFLSGKEEHLATLECFNKEEDKVNDYDGSLQMANDDYERTEMRAIKEDFY